jgi:hypothetical protein
MQTVRVLRNRGPRVIPEYEREGIIAGLGKLRNEELHN